MCFKIKFQTSYEIQFYQHDLFIYKVFSFSALQNAVLWVLLYSLMVFLVRFDSKNFNLFISPVCSTTFSIPQSRELFLNKFCTIVCRLEDENLIILLFYYIQYLNMHIRYYIILYYTEPFFYLIRKFFYDKKTEFKLIIQLNFIELIYLIS